MAKLRPLQLASLLDEIAEAMRTQSPVLEAMRRLQGRRLGAVGRAAQQIADRLERGESVADAIAGLASPSTPQIAAGLRACQNGGDASLLDRMARLLRRRAQLISDMRLAWAYPWLLLTLGYAIAVFVMAPLIRRLDGPDLAWPQSLVRASEWLEAYAWLPPLVVVLAWLLSLWFGSRDRISREDRLSLFCHALADQIRHEVPETVAIMTAAEFSGDPELLQLRDPTFASPEVARILRAASLPNELPAKKTSSDDSIPGEPTFLLVAQLRYLAALHAQRAQRQMYWWSILIPRVATVLVGASLTLAYAWWVIGPVYRQVAQW